MRRNVILVAVLAIGLGPAEASATCSPRTPTWPRRQAASSCRPSAWRQILSSGGKGVKINRETADFVANTWVDYALLGQAVVHGKLPVDSASIAEAVWPEISELKGTHWHDTLMAHRGAVADAAVDSLYEAPDTRVLQHILFGARPNIDIAQRAATKAKAQAALAQIKKGANFEQAGRRALGGPGEQGGQRVSSAEPQGTVCAGLRQRRLVAAPGQVSGLVETPFGYHIIKRPTLDEARGHLTSYLEERAGVTTRFALHGQPRQGAQDRNAPGRAGRDARRRQAAEESKNSDKALVKYTGGQLTVKDYLRWVRALPPQYTATAPRGQRLDARQVRPYPDPERAAAARGGPNKITISPLEWASLKRGYEAQLDTLQGEMGLRTPT